MKNRNTNQMQGSSARKYLLVKWLGMQIGFTIAAIGERLIGLPADEVFQNFMAFSGGGLCLYYVLKKDMK